MYNYGGSFDNEKLDFETFVNLYAMFNEKIRDIAKREGLLLIDLAESIPSNKNIFMMRFI